MSVLEEKWKSGKYNRLQPLRETLLDIGGKEMVPVSYEGILEELLNKGSLMQPDKIETVHGESGQCHRNCAVVYRNQEKILNNAGNVKLGTGWGLSGGLWRQHSWIMNDDMLIETTIKRKHYYGILISGQRAEDFCYKNM
jgi:hypothetical protein